MQLFEGHVATIKALIIQIKLNRFLVKKIPRQKLFQATLSQTINIDSSMYIIIQY